jgi:ferric-dicitrate binding protein FerR (iron transport regulator)
MVNERTTKDAAAGNDPPRDDSIAKLMRMAGPRPAVPPDAYTRVHAAVKREWRSAVAARRTRRWGIPAALAASVIVALVLGGRMLPMDRAPVATVAMTAGAGMQVHMRAGDIVYAGDSITTGKNGLSLSFDNGLSLRLAANTSATLEAIDEVIVTAGTIYADTGSRARADRMITIRTDVGSATDHGTQFAVAYDSGAMSVAVREGSVEVDAPRGSFTAEAGEKLTLDNGGKARYTKLASHDSSWQWATALAPAFDIERRPVMDFLRWVARETGKELVFETDSARLAAMSTRLSGSVAGLTPVEAIEAVQPTISRFEFHVDEQRVIVSLAQ